MIDTLLIAAMKKTAESGAFDGKDPASPYFINCKGRDTKNGVILIFTRDVGMHTGGWWKNPDYERCYHLSISFRNIITWEMMPKNKKISFRYLKAFFGEDHTKLWCEPPYYPSGKEADCWHYRLFCDENWQPIIPRGEVYSKELTEAGWKSFTEIQGRKGNDTN